MEVRHIRGGAHDPTTPAHIRGLASGGKLLSFFGETDMFTRYHPRALFVLSIASWPTISSAQITTPPLVHQFELAQIIRQAGYDCRAVENVNAAPSPDPAFETLRPEVATCSNGKKFLVVRSGRGGANATPIVRPMPNDA
jgi:hypothetical protein